MAGFMTFPDVSKIGGVAIDSGFFRITVRTARDLCTPTPLPSPGCYRVVAFDGHRCEIHRTPVGGKHVWAIMITSNTDISNLPM